MPPGAVSSAQRIIEMTFTPSHSSSTSLCHLQIPPEQHRRACGAAADRLMALVNLLLLAAGVALLHLANASAVAASVPVLGACLRISAGGFIALAVLGAIATAKLTGLLYLHFVLMTALQAGAIFCVGAAVVGRADIGRLATADLYLRQDLPAPALAELTARCDFYSNASDSGKGAAAWERCWEALGAEGGDEPLAVASGADGGDPDAFYYAVLLQACAVAVLLLGMLAAVCDLGLDATTELCMVGVEAITVVLGSCETAFGIWVMLTAPSHNLGLSMVLLGAVNVFTGAFTALWSARCGRQRHPRSTLPAFRDSSDFRDADETVDDALVDPKDFERSRRRLRWALLVHWALLVAFGLFVLRAETRRGGVEYGYQYYSMPGQLPAGLLPVNADTTEVVVARVREVASDSLVASAIGVFSLCASGFTLLILVALSAYIPRLAVEERDSVI